MIKILQKEYPVTAAKFSMDKREGVCYYDGVRMAKIDVVDSKLTRVVWNASAASSGNVDRPKISELFRKRPVDRIFWEI